MSLEASLSAVVLLERTATWREFFLDCHEMLCREASVSLGQLQLGGGENFQSFLRRKFWYLVDALVHIAIQVVHSFG